MASSQLSFQMMLTPALREFFAALADRMMICRSCSAAFKALRLRLAASLAAHAP